MNIEGILQERASVIDKAIERYIPRKFSREDVLFKLNPPRYSYNLESLNKAVANPIWEFLDRGGKRWRPSLFLLVCEALGRRWEDYVDFAIITEVIHNGTLMIDDIEDASECRRGRLCTYKIFGLDIAINAGNAMYYLPLLPLIERRKVLPTRKASRIYEIYAQEMMNLSLGQAVDIAWHRGLVDAGKINEDDYLQMCAYKTGTLARMAAKIAGVLTDANDALVDKLGCFAESVGIAFQIQDDILDLTSEEFAEKKGGRGQDITEGKYSLPVIHALKTARGAERGRLIDILGMHTSDQKLRDEAIAIMQSNGAIEHAKKMSCTMVEKSWKEVESLLPDTPAKEKLKAFAIFLIERNL